MCFLSEHGGQYIKNQAPYISMNFRSPVDEYCFSANYEAVNISSSQVHNSSLYLKKICCNNTDTSASHCFITDV